MHLRNVRRPINNLTRVGLVLLILGSTVHYLVAHRLWPQNDLIDLVEGLLYGLSIGSMSVGVRRSSREEPAGTC